MDAFLRDLHLEIKAKDFKRYKINHGGCGKAAVAFYKYFRQLGKYQVLGVKVLSQRPKKSPNTLSKKGDRYLADFFYHLVLAIRHEGEDYYVDAVYGILPKNRYFKVSGYKHLDAHPGFISFKKIKTMSAEGSFWNTTFDKRDISHLRNFLKEYKA